MRYFPKTTLRNNNGIQLLLKSQKVIKRMTNNPDFPDANSRLAVLVVAVASLRQALTAYDGSPITLQNRKTAEQNVAKAYAQVAVYVNTIANGDRDLIYKSGYDVNKDPQKIGFNHAPVMKRAIKISFYGTVKLMWQSVPKALYYMVHLYDVNQPEVLIRKVASAKSRIYLQELESGKRYIVRVQAFGKRSASPLSAGLVFCEAR